METIAGALPQHGHIPHRQEILQSDRAVIGRHRRQRVLRREAPERKARPRQQRPHRVEAIAIIGILPFLGLEMDAVDHAQRLGRPLENEFLIALDVDPEQGDPHTRLTNALATQIIEPTERRKSYSAAALREAGSHQSWREIWDG